MFRFCVECLSRNLKLLSFEFMDDQIHNSTCVPNMMYTCISWLTLLQYVAHVCSMLYTCKPYPIYSNHFGSIGLPSRTGKRAVPVHCVGSPLPKTAVCRWVTSISSCLSNRHSMSCKSCTEPSPPTLLEAPVSTAQPAQRR